MATVALELDGLFDGERVFSNQGLIIEDGSIIWSGERSRLPASVGGERPRLVRAPGSFALPGLINAHAHLSLSGSADFEAETRQSESAAALKAFRNARLALSTGVTTVRDLGANGTMVVDLAAQIERGDLEGPRIVAACRGVTASGGHGTEIGRTADGVDAVRAAVREQIGAGATVLKLFCTGGVLGAGAGPDQTTYTDEEMRAAIEEAHRAGLKATCHAHGADGIRSAASAGIDSIEHGTLLDGQAIQVLKERNIALVPTLSALRAIIGNEAHLSDRVVERARRIVDQQLDGVRSAYHEGVRIATGTDAGTPFNTHGAFALELRYLLEAGLSALDVLRAATSVAADVIGRPTLGRISEGNVADLVFVSEDPLRDVTAVERNAAVWVRGIAALRASHAGAGRDQA